MNNFNQTILLTGGAGFIASNYINKYVPLSPDTLFVNIDALTYAGNLKNIHVSELSNYRFENVDIRERARLEEVYRMYKPTAVLHFAAESHVDLSLKNPNIFFETNVLGTHNLLSLAKDYGVGRFHLVSTDEVYGALDEHESSFTEMSPIRPRNPYSASKAGADVMVMAYHETFGLDVIITRSSNTYGPNQDNTKLIPHFVSKLAKGERVPLYGEGLQVRDWMFVEDCIDGIHMTFSRGRSGEIYNVGGGHELKNIELTMKLLAYFDKDESSISYVEDRLGHDFRYALNVEKIKNELGWSPKTNFEMGLQKTIDSLLT
jgi:dTDP-glucose 4,6-dehydratase